jgi:hypothetical protein
MWNSALVPLPAPTVMARLDRSRTGVSGTISEYGARSCVTRDTTRLHTSTLGQRALSGSISGNT